MQVKVTSPEQRAKLTAAGYVRVDGLGVIDRVRSQSNDFSFDYVIGPSFETLGRWDANNGVSVICTIGGEVWLACGMVLSEEDLNSLRRELCPEGRGAYVPCSNGEDLRWSDIFKRIADPDCQPI